MNPRKLSKTSFLVALLALSSSFTFGQQTTGAPPPASPYSTPATARAPMPPHLMMQGHSSMGPMMHGRDARTGLLGFGMERKWWHDAALAQQLNLTADQIKRMDTVFEQSRLQLIDLRANVEKQEIVLEPLLSANPLDMGRARAQIEKVARARADLEVASAGMLLGIRAVLTPDQWTLLNQRHEHREFHRQEGPGGQMRQNGGSGSHRDAQPGPPGPPPGI